MKEFKGFETSYGTHVGASRMGEVVHRLREGEDWQRIANEELIDVIPQGPNMVSEMNEVICEAQARADEEPDKEV